MINLLSVALIAVALVSACSLLGVPGSGPVVTESRSVEPFTRVDAGHGIALEIEVGPAQTVEVRAQSNIAPLITTTSQGGTLTIAVSSPIDPSTEKTVVIAMPSLEAITLSGGSNGDVNGLSGTAIGATVSGGAVLTATGTIDSVTVVASGGARADLLSLAATSLTVDASGGAVVEAQVSTEVHGTASGGARVSIAGPAVLNVEASGGANVQRLP
jgi:hypothetical protein